MVSWAGEGVSQEGGPGLLALATNSLPLSGTEGRDAPRSILKKTKLGLGDSLESGMTKEEFDFYSLSALFFFHKLNGPVFSDSHISLPMQNLVIQVS